MSKMTMAKIVDAMMSEGEKDAAPNKHGNTVYRLSCSASRYSVDFAPDFAEECWQQFDTSQDAAYFGVWVNRPKRLTLSYAEGDWVLVVCPTLVHYRAEVESYIRFFDDGVIAVAVEAGPGGPFGTPAARQDRVTVFRQNRKEMFLDPVDFELADEDRETVAPGDEHYYRTPGAADR